MELFFWSARRACDEFTPDCAFGRDRAMSYLPYTPRYVRALLSTSLPIKSLVFYSSRSTLPSASIIRNPAPQALLHQFFSSLTHLAPLVKPISCSPLSLVLLFQCNHDVPSSWDMLLFGSFMLFRPPVIVRFWLLLH